MKKSRFSEEQLIGFLHQAQAGMAIPDLCRSGGFSHAIPGEFEYTGMVGRAGMMRASSARHPDVEEVNFGVDIARLVPSLESGAI